MDILFQSLLRTSIVLVSVMNPRPKPAGFPCGSRKDHCLYHPSGDTGSEPTGQSFSQVLPVLWTDVLQDGGDGGAALCTG